jgi:mono/diheme cytochrome c family protein
MIPAFMSRPAKVLLISSLAIVVAALAAACGTQRIGVAQSDPVHEGAVLFSQRCSGCHTLAYAAANGSAANVRTAQFNNGPNFNVRCERPLARVLYAIENGGFSGAIMPQNVVVGQDAADVARFVSKYAGTKAARAPGVPICTSQAIGTLPPPTAVAAAGSSASGGTTSTASETSTLPKGPATGTGKSGGGKNKKKKATAKKSKKK